MRSMFPLQFKSILLLLFLSILVVSCNDSDLPDTSGKPSIGSFTANPATITSGQIATLSWSGVTDADTLRVDPDAGSISGSSGNVTVSPTVTTTYTLTATNDAGSTTDTVTVTVQGVPQEKPAIGSFTVNPATITSGQSATLSWSNVTDADTLRVDPDVGSISGSSGNVTVSPAATTTYTLTATNDAGSTTALIRLAVEEADPTDPDPSATGWLHTEGNQILDDEGNRFLGRGVNIGDTREAGVCCWVDPAEAGTVTTIKARVDTLADEWNATFIRLVLDIYASGCSQSGDMVKNQDYKDDVQEIVDHIGTKDGVYVMVSLHEHPANAKDSNGWVPDFTVPSTSSYGNLEEVYTTLVEMFCNSPHVIIGVGNEPHGKTDEYVWTAMNHAVEVIREAEEALSCPSHLVAVQGTQDWGRDLSYYVAHPIQAGGGANVIYETHSYDQRSDWNHYFLEPSETLPVIVGEFGPYKECDVADCLNSGSMYYEDTDELTIELEDRYIPYTGWAYSGHNAPRMFFWERGSAGFDCSNPDGEWTGDISPWGELMKARLALPWGDDTPAYSE